MRSTALLCLLLLAIAGCGGIAAPLSPSPSPSPQRPTNSVGWGMVGLSDVPTLDPALASDPASISVASLVYGGLVRLDGSLHVQPDAATSWTISRDGKRYTFTLRNHLRFWDGRPVYASDVVSALRRALGPDESSGTASVYLDLIAQPTTAGIRALDARTVQITLARPAAHFLTELAFPTAFVPDPTVIARYGTTWTDHAAGFGPYIVRTWRHSRFLVLKRNPYYYGGKQAIRTITVRFYGKSSALRAYDRSEIDIVSGIEPGETLSGKHQGLQRTRGLALDYLAFNTTRLPFSRIDARRALAAVWSPAFLPSTMGSSVFPTTGVLPTAFGLPTVPWKPKKTPATYLAAAHYKKGHGFPDLTLVMPHDPHLHRLGLALSRSWARSLGITVNVRQLNLSNYLRVLNARAFDLAFVRWGADYPDPQNFLGTQLGPSHDNVTGWNTKAYDRLVPLADSYNPLDGRRAGLFREAARMVRSQLPILPLDEPALAVLVRPTLRGVAVTGLGTIWIDPARLSLKVK